MSQHNIIMINCDNHILGIISESLQDLGFNILSAEAHLAKETAQKIKIYLLDPQTKESLKPYESFLIQIFDLWTSIPPKTSPIREQIWRRFSVFTSSTDYITFWKGFYSLIGITGSPVLSFYITYTLFIRYWSSKYPANELHHDASEVSHLTYEEQNALWYVAGYILKKVKKEVKGNEGIIDYFIEEGTDTDNEEIEDDCNAQNWLNIIDRGGLTKCTNDFYTFLRAVELELKSLLEKSLDSTLGHPKTVIQTLLEKVSIIDSWNILVTPLPDSSSADTIKQKILQLYVTVRSFAFTTKKMEQHKISNKENIQKSKSLRSKLQASKE